MSDFKLILSRAVAESENDLIVAGVFDDWDTYEPATRTYGYRRERGEKPWGSDDHLFHTADMCIFKDPEDKDISYFVALSSEGEVYHHGLTKSFTEQIKGAGIYHENSKQYGRMQSIRQIGSKLYACGSGGQIYVRNGRDDWRLLTKDLLWDPEAFAYDADEIPDEEKDTEAYEAWEKGYDESQKDNVNHLLYDINGPSENEIYICGEDGLLYLWDGESLEDVDPGTESALTNIHVAEDGIVWICGREGQLFSGNEEEGFEDHSEEGSRALYTSITTYKGKVLLASQTNPFGLFEFDQKKEKIKRVTPHLKPVLRSIHTIQAVGDVLWLIGRQDILRLEDDNWERIQHPDIPVPQL